VLRWKCSGCGRETTNMGEIARGSYGAGGFKHLRSAPCPDAHSYPEGQACLVAHYTTCGVWEKTGV
jgi:hypothetical protein